MLEFNELTPLLMDRFIEQGKLPNFRRFKEQSYSFITDAQAEGEDLNPWVQWVTVHSGINTDLHGVKYLSDGHKLDFPAIWDIVSEDGLPVLVVGSMNGRYDKPLNGALIPDPWSSGLRCYPEGDFEIYYSFIRNAVQEHTNPEFNANASGRDFVKWMARHGLSINTIFRIVTQLVQQKVTGTSWKKAVILDRLQWDVFKYYYKRLRPSFSTFFSNSTAHYQHKYWRHMEPDIFTARPPESEVKKYRNAIQYGYEQADKLVGRFMDLADENTTIVFCTAHGQQPYLGHEDTGGRIYYRIKNVNVLSDKLKIGVPFSYEPVMAEQFFLRFQNAIDQQHALDYLRGLITSGRPTFHVQSSGDGILVQCQESGQVPRETCIETPHGTISFYDVFYRVDGSKSGYHHPDGLLWVRTPQKTSESHTEKVPLTDIAPTILDILGVPPAPYMQGKSLLHGAYANV